MDLLLRTSETRDGDALMRRLRTLDPDDPTRKTLEVQVPLALEPDAYRAWGQHYLLTLPLMIDLRRRSNFRDECLAGFGKDALGRECRFHALADEAEMTFARLTPPPPSLLTRRSHHGHQAQGAQQALPSEFMRGGVCFSGDSKVTVLVLDLESPPSPSAGEEAPAGRLDGTRAKKLVRDVIKGDLVETTLGFAEVDCVVISKPPDDRKLVQVSDDARLTPWHPVRTGGVWRFPHDLAHASCTPALGHRWVDCDDVHVFNFVLKQRAGAALFLGGVPCAVLGHNIRDDDVVSHLFWGSDDVIDAVRSHPGYAAGVAAFTVP